MRKISLKSSMILWIWGFAALIFLLVININFIYSKKALEKRIEDDAVNLSRYYGKRLDVVFSQASVIPQVIAAHLETEYEDNEVNQPELLKKFLKKVAEANPFIFGVCVAFEPYAFNEKIKAFAPYYYYEDGKITYDQLGEDADYNYFKWDWYKLPKEKGNALWTEPYSYPGAGEVTMITYSYPFFWDKKFIGVAEVDISLDKLKVDIDKLKVLETGYGFMLSAKGTFLSYPDKDKIMKANISTVSPALAQEVKDLEKIGSGGWVFLKTKDPFRGEDAWVILRPVRDSVRTLVGSVGFVYPVKEIYADIYSLRKKIALIAVAGLILLLLIIIAISNSISQPISRLAAGVVKFAQGQLDYKVSVNAKSAEVEALQVSFNKMSDDLKAYIKNLKETTAAKERIESELKIAHEIQVSMLPRIFPPFPERKEFEIFAVMEPAKEVGGDFYDFFLINNDKLCFLLGDVSGKGVPAALFMVISKILLKTAFLDGLSPDAALSRVNNTLYTGNDTSMFLTVLCMVLDLKSGKIEYSSAGHNPPLLYSGSGDFDFLPVPKGFVLGAMPDTKYQNQEIVLKDGAAVFLYTDGVTEAMNMESKQFSEQRLKDDLRKFKDKDLTEMIHGMRVEIKNFTMGAEQSDDITILALRFKGAGH